MKTWKIDPNHSEITFKVKHLVITTVSGKFTKFDSSLETEKPDFSDAVIRFSADVNSITTGNDQRDNHLRSADFFDAENHPTLSFVSKEFIHKNGSHYVLKGNLTIRGTTRSVDLDVEFGGTQKDFSGNTVAGFEIRGRINRHDFGLAWDGITEDGGVVVSSEVRLDINVEFVKAGVGV